MEHKDHAGNEHKPKEKAEKPTITAALTCVEGANLTVMEPMRAGTRSADAGADDAMLSCIPGVNRTSSEADGRR